MSQTKNQIDGECLNTELLLSTLEELIPNSLKGDVLDYSELMVELLMFGIFSVRELERFWKEVSCDVEDKEKESWQSLKKSNPELLVDKQYPWTHSRVGLVRSGLSLKFKAYWDLYNSGNDELRRASIIQQNFSPK